MALLLIARLFYHIYSKSFSNTRALVHLSILYEIPEILLRAIQKKILFITIRDIKLLSFIQGSVYTILINKGNKTAIAQYLFHIFRVRSFPSTRQHLH